MTCSVVRGFTGCYLIGTWGVYGLQNPYRCSWGAAMGFLVSLLGCVMNPYTKSTIEVGSVCPPHQDASTGGMRSAASPFPPLSLECAGPSLSPCHSLMCRISWMLCTYMCAGVSFQLVPLPWETPWGAAGIPHLGKPSGYHPPAAALVLRGPLGCLLGLYRGVWHITCLLEP